MNIFKRLFQTIKRVDSNQVESAKDIPDSSPEIILPDKNPADTRLHDEHASATSEINALLSSCDTDYGENLYYWAELKRRVAD
jgi:hypothetical protein